MRLARCLTGLAVAVCALPQAANADPCGLVPPLRWAGQTPIKRIGVQKTYVFYKDGLETLALRPGFSGKVDEFGMLIPFPTPPAIRKLPDNVFEQIAAAIDPPEVVIDLRHRAMMGSGFGGGGFGGGGGAAMMGGMTFMREDEIRVIREEAVGMYEVAVLAAGSPKALKRWMDEHEYTYPSGMDAVCPEYIDSGWCFVAVKTKVKQKDAAQPQPGQRAIDNDLPEDASFDGHVQAMGFRFRTRRLVVPMRLSVHNSGDLRNIVYLLADEPAKIRNIPEKFVVRQVSGFKLFDQLTEPLPVRILGGTINDVPRATRIGLAKRRDPGPRNGVAAELFASDILAARTGRLESRSEEIEKDLLQINEALGLRGDEIDGEVRRALRRRRAQTVRSTLKTLDRMTLTVIDGDFPREVLARENLTFTKYRMPRERSNRTYYDAIEMGPARPKLGLLLDGELGETAIGGAAGPAAGGKGRGVVTASASKPLREEGLPRREQSSATLWLALIVGCSAVGLLLARRRPRRRASILLLVTLLAGCLSLAATARSADKLPSMEILMERLGNPDLAEETAAQLVSLGDKAVSALIVRCRTRDPIKRGWAIVCLGRIGGAEATGHLTRIYTDRDTPQLIRTWAAAAAVKAARSNEELAKLSGLAQMFPAVSRPMLLEFQRRLRAEDGVASIEGVLVAAAQNPALEQAMAKQILATGAKPLVTAMLQAESQEIRRKAAGYVATYGVAPENTKEVTAAVAHALKFAPGAKQVPWRSGPLFLPGIRWPPEEARLLVGNLIRWLLWAERNQRSDEARQIHNNLRSVALAGAAGYSVSSSHQARGWLTNWKAVVGREEVKRILAEQDVEDEFEDVIGAEVDDLFG